MLLCICVSVTMYVNACLMFVTFMKLQFIFARFIVIIFMPCEEFLGVYISLVKFGLDIHGRKGDSPK